MNRTGYIKLHRSFLEWEWHDNPNVVTILIHLLLNARFSPGEYRGRALLPGQLITGREKLARETGLSPDQVRTAMKHLQKSGVIQIEPSNRYSVVTVVNWERYQNNEGQSPAGYPTPYGGQMQACQRVPEYEADSIPNVTPDESPENPQQIPSEHPNKSPYKKNDKKEKREKGKETIIMDVLPADLSSDELLGRQQSDEAIEDAAHRNGIPVHEAGMHMARKLASDYGLEALLEAIDIAGRGKAQTWAYVEGILKRRSASLSKSPLPPHQSYSTWDVNPYAEYEGAND